MWEEKALGFIKIPVFDPCLATFSVWDHCSMMTMTMMMMLVVVSVFVSAFAAAAFASFVSFSSSFPLLWHWPVACSPFVSLLFLLSPFDSFPGSQLQCRVADLVAVDALLL